MIRLSSRHQFSVKKRIRYTIKGLLCANTTPTPFQFSYFQGTVIPYNDGKQLLKNLRFKPKPIDDFFHLSLSLCLSITTDSSLLSANFALFIFNLNSQKFEKQKIIVSSLLLVNKQTLFSRWYLWKVFIIVSMSIHWYF